jgi:hypothetical protein
VSSTVIVLYLRAVLKCHGDGVSVNTSHEETKQTSHSQELLKGAGVDGSDLEKTKNDHVKHHWPLATELVSSYTEHSRTNGAKKQSKGDRCGDSGVRCIVVSSKLSRLDRESVEIESIGSPRKESDDEVKPVFQSKLSEQAEWVLERLRLLPFAVFLAVVIANDYTLVPGEKIFECLFGGWDNALCQWVCGAVRARHVV